MPGLLLTGLVLMGLVLDYVDFLRTLTCIRDGSELRQRGRVIFVYIKLCFNFIDLGQGILRQHTHRLD